MQKAHLKLKTYQKSILGNQSANIPFIYLYTFFVYFVYLSVYCETDSSPI